MLPSHRYCNYSNKPGPAQYFDGYDLPFAVPQGLTETLFEEREARSQHTSRLPI
ncbi:hypothetical protein [Hymenobacter fastidiosus]|uniref:hypothetical protein n=1 Tax=Hymenobacter fastidiosus TaxID=486264 RepID=UPI0031F0506C